MKNLNSMQALEVIYLDWFNNFISVEGFASHYGITEEHASRLIDLARTVKPNEADM